MVASAKKREKLLPDRFRRIWALVEEIAAAPGQRRADLAQKFHLSERQIQADLNRISADMGLPLVRQRGYRFVAEDGSSAGPSSLTAVEAQTLVILLAAARRSRAADAERIDAIDAKLPSLFPPHLQPLMRHLSEATRRGNESRVVHALADAALSGMRVRVHGASWLNLWKGNSSLVIAPELLLPYRGEWYVLGRVGQGEHRPHAMLPVADILAVEAAAGRKGVA